MRKPLLTASSQTASLLVYLFGMIFTENLVMIFIITILLLAADFYYLKNIAGRRLVGLRWWNEVDPSSGDSHWVFESSEPGTKTINATDSRFFWMAMYVQPLLWVALAILALIRLKFIWLPLVGKSPPPHPWPVSHYSRPWSRMLARRYREEGRVPAG